MAAGTIRDERCCAADETTECVRSLVPFRGMNDVNSRNWGGFLSFIDAGVAVAVARPSAVRRGSLPQKLRNPGLVPGSTGQQA